MGHKHEGAARREGSESRSIFVFLSGLRDWRRSQRKHHPGNPLCVAICRDAFVKAAGSSRLTSVLVSLPSCVSSARCCGDAQRQHRGALWQEAGGLVQRCLVTGDSDSLAEGQIPAYSAINSLLVRYFQCGNSANRHSIACPPETAKVGCQNATNDWRSIQRGVLNSYHKTNWLQIVCRSKLWVEDSANRRLCPICLIWPDFNWNGIKIVDLATV